ncbi:hypothetical protein V500_06949 [Pseudogymnoascus sp. VKM F-4518 (FW-2643)]|nr:hypothetical protein V500_06949 [Pseudogymnoascus sp. VKM F-4518 (FW-2643)]
MEQFGGAYHHIPFPPMITDPYGFLPVPASQTLNPPPRASLLAQRSQFFLAPPTPPASPTMHPGWAPAPPAPMASTKARRIAQLRTYLDPTHQDYQNVEQHANIRKAITNHLARPPPICLRNAELNGELRPTTVATPAIPTHANPTKTPRLPYHASCGAPSGAPNGGPGAAATQNPVPYFSPAMPISPVISVPDTIASLRTYLDPSHCDYWMVEQHVNIRKDIPTYESGELRGEVVSMDGKVVSDEEALGSGRWRWNKVNYTIIVEVSAKNYTGRNVGSSHSKLNMGNVNRHRLGVAATM